MRVPGSDSRKICFENIRIAGIHLAFETFALAGLPWLPKHVAPSVTRGAILDGRTKRLMAKTGNIAQPRP